MLFFFFQAEDGIRDYKVTGVQTCALPIPPRPCHPGARAPRREARESRSPGGPGGARSGAPGGAGVARARHVRDNGRPVDPVQRTAAPGRAHPLTSSNARVYLCRSVNINAFGLILLGGSDMSHHCTLKAVAVLNPATPTDGSGRRA